jgi:hypothetical protein
MLWVLSMQNPHRSPSYFECQAKLLWKPRLLIGYEPFVPRPPTQPPPLPGTQCGNVLAEEDCVFGCVVVQSFKLRITTYLGNFP